MPYLEEARKQGDEPLGQRVKGVSSGEGWMFLEDFQGETGLEMTWSGHSWQGKGGNETQDWVAGWY